MNRTVVFLAFATLAALGIIGATAILLLRPDATATLTGFIVQILGLASVAAVTFYGLGKANEKLERVEKQTNGTLSKLLVERDTALAIVDSRNAEIAQLKATHPEYKET